MSYVMTPTITFPGVAFQMAALRPKPRLPTHLSYASALRMPLSASFFVWALLPCRWTCIQLCCSPPVPLRLRQPNKRLPPLVSEFASVVSVQGPVSVMPDSPTLSCAWPLPPECFSQHKVPVLPVGTKRLSAFLTSGNQEGLEGQGSACVKFGIPWLPKDFVTQAIKCKHPKLLTAALPGPLKECI